MKFAALGLTLLALVAAPLASLAEEKKPPAVTQAAPGVKRTILQKFDVPGTNYETTLMRVEFEPNFKIDRHFHPGVEASFVLEGEVTLVFDGQEPKLMKAGDTLYFPANVIHSGTAGGKGVILINSYILEKGKPLLIKVDADGKPIPPEPPK